MKPQTLIQFADRLLTTCTKSDSRKRCLSSTIEKLRLFKGDKNFDDINKGFFDSFLGQNKKYSQSTLNRDISNIRYLLNEAIEEGLTTNTKFRTTKFHAPKDEGNGIYLTESELMAIYYLELSKSKSNVRDLFLLESFLGQRFGDIVRLTEQDLQGDTVTIRQQKSKAVASVPIHWVIKEIISQRGMPYPVSLTHLNRELPKIGFDAGIKEMVQVTRTVNGKLVTKSVPKYSLIRSHVGRRSMITNCIKAGIPTERVRLLSGHSKNSTSFNKYIRLSTQENATELVDHSFFKSKPQKSNLRKVG